MATIIETLELREAAVSAAEMVMITKAGSARQHYSNKAVDLVEELAKIIDASFSETLRAIIEDAKSNLAAKKVI